MGRSLYRATPESMAEPIKSSRVFFHQPSHSYLDMLQRDGGFYQRRWQVGFDGRDTNVDEKRIDYGIRLFPRLRVVSAAPPLAPPVSLTNFPALVGFVEKPFVHRATAACPNSRRTSAAC